MHKPASPGPSAPADSWWRSAAIYQLYVRSFADGNGDGIGDLAGARAHLPYLAELGVDAIWFNPWYPSPMSDAGYDICDYRGIEPVFGTLSDADDLIGEAHGHGIRIIIDVVPNHCSDQHPWFTEALAAGPGSAARDRFWFRPGRYLSCPWDATALRQVIDQTLALNAPAGAPAIWVLSNHDVDRIVSRYGRADTAFSLQRRRYFHSFPVDLELGTRRARAAALLTLALPGSVYIYQGEELGLWEVQDIRDELRQDPIWQRTHGEDPGRDGSRVPLPWSGTEPPFGFSPPGASGEPWLPQPKEWRDLTVGAESASADSVLSLYRAALRIRRSHAALGDGPMTWLPAADGVLAFGRGASVRCVANLSASPIALPPDAAVLLASGPLTAGLLPPGTTAWLRTEPGGPHVPGAPGGPEVR